MSMSPSIREPGGKNRRQDKQLLFPKQRAFLRPASPASNCGAQPRTGTQPADAPAKNADAGLPWQGTVLFVSDDDYFRATARAYLEHVGLSVRSCADPTRVPDLLVRKPAIDLLLVDVHAIGTAGRPLAAELAAFAADLPAIIISAPNGDNGALAAIPNRSWKILSKPVLLPELLEAIHAALGRKNPLERCNSRSSLTEDDGAAAGQSRRAAVSRQAAGRSSRLLLMQGTL
jgi:DNA-binding NtrC family response regulator